ncbi:TlpA disulfide reductase family protein [Streptococcus pacificus]|uniref:TlpA family protein disulfide reductase n=1 Tax=Streptococcus pacificus TaxID=2740577 RepID=A0ABS0ZK94_9STRE|nr:TlpA disulfide reductase family protein [Streptococcus pacificus]MBJ8326133.1 TlpA family protein disulfide reductase [Streptococcus pacificus]
MKKITLLTTGLVCLGLLGACSNTTQENMPKEAKTTSNMTKKDDMNKDSKTEMKDSEMQGSDDMATMNDGEMAYDFTLTGVDGKTYHLSDYKGKKVYLKFWASWCSICLATLEDTVELSEMADDDYVVLSVVAPTHNGEKTQSEFKKWYQGLGYDQLPVLLDNDGELLKAYGVRSYPTSAFIGSDGVLVKTHIGFMEKSDIEKTLKEIK